MITGNAEYGKMLHELVCIFEVRNKKKTCLIVTNFIFTYKKRIIYNTHYHPHHYDMAF